MIKIDINLVFTIINLIVLYLLMKKFLFGPIIAVMEKRKAMIDEQFASAEKTTAEANQLKGQYEDALKSAKEESFSIVEQAKDEAKVQADSIVKRANDQAGQILEKARRDISTEQEAAMKAMEGKVAELAMDAASSEWKGSKKGEYVLPKCGKKFTSAQLVEHWKNLIEKYPIYSIEDGLDEEDWEGWQIMTKELGGKVQLVGDDLFVTNTERLEKGISLGCGNSILIKLNQIGSVSETLEAIKMAHKAGYTAISSHRSGETEDTTIADLAVALNTCQIKTGAPSRSERVAKYNQLLRIEEELGDAAVYPGFQAFNIKR